MAEQRFPILVMSLMQQSSPERPAPRSLHFAPPHSPHPAWMYMREMSGQDGHEFPRIPETPGLFIAEGASTASLAALLLTCYDLDKKKKNAD